MEGQTLDLKTSGYNLFKTGIHELHAYSKMETNLGLQQLTKEKVGGFC